jgi:hypothetical protein
MSDDKNNNIEKIQKKLNEIKEKEKKLKKDLKIAKENEKNENIKKIYEKFKDDLDIPKEKNAKNIDNIINKKIIRKGEKSDNDIIDCNDNDNDNIKQKLKEYKTDYKELNQTVIGKDAMTFLEKK